jgi:hypothetical protein
MLTEWLQRLVEQLALLSQLEQGDLAARIEADLEEERRGVSAMHDTCDLVLDKRLEIAKQEVASQLVPKLRPSAPSQRR